MQKYVALLRGINVGGNNKVAMKELKSVFEELGYKNVRTYINSGNVLFETKATDTSKLCTSIEGALKKVFDMDLKIVIRTLENLTLLCDKIPQAWKNDEYEKTDVLFLWPNYDNKESITKIVINKDVDTLKYIDGAIVWHIKRADYKKSGMNKFISTQIYKNTTVRNINTVRTITKMLSAV